MELRPLGFGELFDRAITIFVRNFRPFALIAVVLVVPLLVTQMVASQTESQQFAVFGKILAHPGSNVNSFPSIFDSPRQFAVLAISSLIFYILTPFVFGAAALAVASLYRGRPIDVRACYRLALARWPTILGVILLQVLILGAWYTTTVIGAALFIVVAAFVVRQSAIVGTVAIIIAVVFFVFMLLVLLQLLLAASFALFAAIVEQKNLGASIGSSFVRVFNREQFWRSMLFSIAASAVTVTASVMIAVIDGVFVAIHLTAVGAACDAVLRTAITPFSIILIAVYYFDVRIRSEGYDLEAQLDTIAPEPLA